MRVTDVVETIVDVFPDAILVSSLGTATSAVLEVTGDGPHFYFGAAMGCAVGGALGLADAVPQRQIVAVVGDGDFLMGANSLWSVSAYRPGNLIVVVLADGAYSITGGQAIGVPLRLAGVAGALDGLTGAAADTADALRGALKSADQPGIVEARITERVWPGPSPFVDPPRVSRRVRRNVAGR